MRDGTPKDTITVEEVRARYSYDKNTGVLRHTDYVSHRPHRHGKEAGHQAQSGYRILTLHKRPYKVHRIVWLHFYGEYPPEFIDHINRVRDDNRICNLRATTPQQNKHNGNTYATNTSGETGVVWHSGNRRWYAKVSVDGVQKHLGYFGNFEDAVAVRRRAQAELDAVIFAINPENQEAP